MDFFRHLYPPKKTRLKKKNLHPVFWIFLKISNIDLGSLKSKFFKSEKSTKFAIKKNTYSENFKIFAQKLWFCRTNCNLFFGTPCTIPYGGHFGFRVKKGSLHRFQKRDPFHKILKHSLRVCTVSHFYLNYVVWLHTPVRDLIKCKHFLKHQPIRNEGCDVRKLFTF